MSQSTTKRAAFSLEYSPGKTRGTHLILGLSEPIEPWLLLRELAKMAAQRRPGCFTHLGHNLSSNIYSLASHTAAEDKNELYITIQTSLSHGPA